ncbi:MAG: CBS domain-containing protein [Methanomicrobiaceae archaeon]|nr:CBS domain-containing protein [Methanomicrobiaceae archaeon]
MTWTKMIPGEETEFIEHTPIASLMRSDFPRVHPETSISEIFRSFAQRGCADVIVIDDDGKFLGIITRLDLLASITPEMGIRSRRKMGCVACILMSAARHAREVMSRGHITVPDTYTLADTLVFMEKARHPDVIVVNSDGIAVGHVEMCDIIAFLVEKKVL